MAALKKRRGYIPFILRQAQDERISDCIPLVVSLSNHGIG